MKQEGFAAALGVAGSSVGNWESGRKRPSPRVLEKMADLAPAFRAEIEALLSTYEWHPRPTSRVSRELRDELVLALDIILENAPSAVIEDVNRRLTRLAGDYTQLDTTGRRKTREKKREVVR